MQPNAGFGYWLRTYLVLGALWCVITNVHAAITGAPTALVAASGPATGTAKAADVDERVVRPILG